MQTPAVMTTRDVPMSESLISDVRTDSSSRSIKLDISRTSGRGSCSRANREQFAQEFSNRGFREATSSLVLGVS